MCIQATVKCWVLDSLRQQQRCITNEKEFHLPKKLDMPII